MDPRLAALYDIDNPDGPDHDHYRNLVSRLDAKTIIDLGCGTGILTVTLAGPDQSVIGIDPDAGMLDVAKRRDGTEQVTWVLGDSRNIGNPRADLVLMTGNAAQHVGPDDWPRTLADIAAGLRTGGVVGFETRNPAAEAWRTWTPELTRGNRETAGGRMTEWLDVTEPDASGTVILTAHNVWDATGEDVVITQPLTFRSLEQITTDLAAAGIVVTTVWGGWHQEPLADSSRLMVVEAEKT